MRVVAAMSGGVDSAAAAVLEQGAGRHVAAVTLNLVFNHLGRGRGDQDARDVTHPMEAVPAQSIS